MRNELLNKNIMFNGNAMLLLLGGVFAVDLVVFSSVRTRNMTDLKLISAIAHN